MGGCGGGGGGVREMSSLSVFHCGVCVFKNTSGRFWFWFESIIGKTPLAVLVMTVGVWALGHEIRAATPLHPPPP